MPAERTFKKTPKQIEAINIMSNHVEVLLEGGSRSGKTFIGIYAIIARAIKYTESRHLIVRKHFNHIKTSIWYQTIPDVLKNAFPDIVIKQNKQDWFIEIEGSQIWIAGTDDKERIEKILGSEWDTIYMNEASQMAYDTYDTFKTRLNPQKNIKPLLLIDYNPPSMSHWGYVIFHKMIEYDTRQPIKNKDRYSMIKMNPHDNIENLSDGYIDTLETMSERKRKRFLWGNYSDDAENALWKREWIEKGRIHDFGEIEKILETVIEKIAVGVDPAVSGTEKSDDTGIIVAAKGKINGELHYFIMDDRTFHGAVTGWGQEVCKAYNEYKANIVIGEVNNGGDLVEVNIRNYDKTIHYKSVRATRGKAKRAEPIADLYERGIVHHLGYFNELEDEQCSWTEESNESPDRMDALVWVLSYLSGKTFTFNAIGPDGAYK